MRIHYICCSGFTDLKYLSFRKCNGLSAESMESLSGSMKLVKLEFERCPLIHGGFIHLEGLLCSRISCWGDNILWSLMFGYFCCFWSYKCTAYVPLLFGRVLPFMHLCLLTCRFDEPWISHYKKLQIYYGFRLEASCRYILDEYALKSSYIYVCVWACFMELLLKCLPIFTRYISGLVNLKELQISCSDITNVGVSYLRGIIYLFWCYKLLWWPMIVLIDHTRTACMLGVGDLTLLLKFPSFGFYCKKKCYAFLSVSMKTKP